MEEVFESAEIFSERQYDEMISLNIGDYLKRFGPALGPFEISRLLQILEHRGGLVDEVKISLALDLFQRYISEYEYYNKELFNERKEKIGYLSILSILARRLPETQGPNLRERFSELFNRSLSYWKTHNSEFEPALKIWLYESIVQLSGVTANDKDLDFIEISLKEISDKLSNSCLCEEDIPRIELLNSKFEFLEKNQLNKLLKSLRA